ncbi:D-hexose-6-phosphate mutarotase [Psychromonas sp. MME2]|uniref:D-hexose-6-phosphate mutarotase n=1 Tax=unclassified Psychromonas TaxID=2614957 RepID=UPI00339BC000
MISQLSLNKSKQLSTSVSLQTDEQGAEYLVVEHAKLEASFSLFGAHLLHFKLMGQEPIIWLSDNAVFNTQNAIRGGVPICWPWFGPANKSLGDNLPSHGFARNSFWSIGNVTELPHNAGVEITFLLKENEQTLKLWPFHFELCLTATLTDTLKLDLQCTNTGKHPFAMTAALHTYFNISSPNQCSIVGLGEAYVDKLNKNDLQVFTGDLKISGAIDRIYSKAKDVIFIEDHAFNRRIAITNTGNDSDVVWTPWIAGAKSFSDMSDDGYLTMVCVESTITNTNSVKLAPSESHHLITDITSIPQ